MLREPRATVPVRVVETFEPKGGRALRSCPRPARVARPDGGSGLVAYLVSRAEMEAAAIAIMIAVLCAITGARMCERKGRSPALGMALGFFLALIGLIIIGVLPDLREGEQNAAGGANSSHRSAVD